MYLQRTPHFGRNFVPSPACRILLAALLFSILALALSESATAGSGTSSQDLDVEASEAALSAIPGACCHSDGLCFTETRRECLQVGGSYLGPNTPCDVDPCRGGCCGPDGTCTVELPGNCGPDVGDFIGYGTVCDPSPCDGPLPVLGTSWGALKQIFGVRAH